MTSISTLLSDVTTYESVSGDISFSGLGNGTDFTEIIEALVDAESFKLEDYEDQLEEQEYIVALLEDLSDSLSSLQNVLEEFDSIDSFLTMDVVASDDAISATATGDATQTTHSIVVNQLAQVDIMATDTGWSSSTTSVTTSGGALSLSYGDTTYTIDVPAGTTLDELAQLVNADCDGDITASVLYDGSAYYMLLTGADSGADNDITVTSGTTLAGFEAADFNNTQECCDAEFKVDGFPMGSNSWITRSSNDIDDVIDGVSLNLNATTDGEAVTLSLSYDEDALKENIETFITEVNQIILDIQTLTGKITTYVTTDDGDQEEAPYINNYALNMMYSNIKTVLSTIGQGFVRYDSDSGEGDAYTVLSQLGITTDAETGSDSFGQLLIDDDELDEAIAEDPYAVAMLFAASGELSTDSTDVSVISTIETVTEAGEYEVEYTISGGVIVSASIDGEEALIDGWTLTSMSGDSKGLYLNVDNKTDGSYSATVSIKQGKVGELIDTIQDMIDSEDGTLTILIETCEDNITSLEDDIDFEEKRLSNYEDALTRKYAALDSVLAEYTELESTLESLISQLSD